VVARLRIGDRTEIGLGSSLQSRSSGRLDVTESHWHLELRAKLGIASRSQLEYVLT
jgi:hypothetical protein